MNASRLYTLRFGRTEYRNCVFSVGRVQTPTLTILAARQKEIEEFVPEDYWTISTIYRGIVFNCAQKFSESDAKEKLASLRGKPFKVTSVENKKGSEFPPQLYDLTSLQVDCNKKFGFTADDTLKYVQQLYEQKLTTYPRVDTKYLPSDVYDECPRIMGGLAAFSEYRIVRRELGLF